jgi:hypothetical protein
MNVDSCTLQSVDSPFGQENFLLHSNFLDVTQTVQKLTSPRPEYQFCRKILNLDSSIRFVGILCKCGRLKAYDRKKGMIPQLTVPETKLLHREALLKSKMNHVFDKKLGKTNWSVESRDNVKWITVNHDKDLILLSTETSSNHDMIVENILSMLEI